MKTRAAFWALYCFLFVWAALAMRRAFGHARVKTARLRARAGRSRHAGRRRRGRRYRSRPARPWKSAGRSSPLPEGAPPGVLPPPIVETVRVTPSAAAVLTLTRAESGTQRPPDKRAELRAADNAARAPSLRLGACALGVSPSGSSATPQRRCRRHRLRALLLRVAEREGFPLG